MDLKHIRYFAAAVEEGSLQGAATRLNVAQPALSRRVRDLEAELGCALLERSAKGVKPTPAGLVLFRDSVAMIDGLNRTVQAVRRKGFEQGRAIRMGLPPTAPRKYNFVRKALEAFAKQYPDAGIAFTRANSTDLARQIRVGDLDIALLYEQHAGSGQVDERLVHREHYIVAAYPSHPLSAASHAAVADLANEPLVWLARRDLSEAEPPLLSLLRQHGIEPVVSHIADSPEEQLDLVAAGTGLCLTPASTALTAPQGQMRFLPLTGLRATIDLTLAWQREPGSPAAADLRKMLASAIDAHQHSLTADSDGWSWLEGNRLVDPPDRTENY